MGHWAHWQIGYQFSSIGGNYETKHFGNDHGVDRAGRDSLRRHGPVGHLRKPVSKAMPGS